LREFMAYSRTAEIQVDPSVDAKIRDLAEGLK
jgi:hypothetical protein